MSAAPLGPNEPTTTAAVHAGIPLVTTLPHASIQILEPVGKQIQIERTQDHLRQFLLPNAREISETVRLRGPLSMVRSNLKKKKFCD